MDSPDSWEDATLPAESPSPSPIPSTLPSLLPEDFLSNPGPPVIRQRIDFANSPLKDQYSNLYAVILDNVLTPAECSQLVTSANAHTHGTWEPAKVNIGGNLQKLDLETRNCGRVIWDNAELAKKIWDRVKGEVPELDRLEQWPDVTGPGPWKRNETWAMTRLNERMRFLKYTPGNYFRRELSLLTSWRKTRCSDMLTMETGHCDGCYETPDKKERSYFTLHLYLNDSSSDPEGEPLKGGETTFHSWHDSWEDKERLDVEPKIGRVLIFQQRNLIHAGEELVSGVKYTMRTDMMYTNIGGSIVVKTDG
ncbi:MAG: hypothetical protein M1827_001214 [Pycnora praestabilis]|nr:MAG: hypothetical protein M1827_001214 [Pycnora praestabilis]